MFGTNGLVKTIQELTEWARELDDVELVNKMHHFYLELDIPLTDEFGILHDIMVERFVEYSPNVEHSSSGDDLVQDVFPDLIGE